MVLHLCIAMGGAQVFRVSGSQGTVRRGWASHGAASDCRGEESEGMACLAGGPAGGERIAVGLPCSAPRALASPEASLGALATPKGPAIPAATWTVCPYRELVEPPRKWVLLCLLCTGRTSGVTHQELQVTHASLLHSRHSTHPAALGRGFEGEGGSSLNPLHIHDFSRRHLIFVSQGHRPQGSTIVWTPDCLDLDLVLHTSNGSPREEGHRKYWVG